MPSSCRHFEEVRDVEPRTPQGCEECLKTGGQWVHLRLCLICGHVGCCDESPNKHATKHFRHTGHPVMQSMELGFLAGADAVERLGQKRVKATADNADNQLLRQRLGFNRLMRSAALEPPVRLDDRRQDDNRSPRPP